MATIDLTGRSLRDQADVLGRLARSQQGVIVADPISRVKVSVHKGRLNVTVNGYNVFFVSAPEVEVSVTSQWTDS